MGMRTVRLALAALALMAPLPALAQQGSPYSEGGFDQIKTDEDKKAPPQLSVSRKKFDEAVARMFAAVDTNRDGVITVAEFQALIAGRREQAIQERFNTVDANHDKTISYAEFSAWQHSLGALALSDADAGGGQGMVAEEIRYQPRSNREDEMIAEMLEPLRTTVITAANTNYDAGASLAELTAYEGKRFEAIDTNHDGWVTDDEWMAAHPSWLVSIASKRLPS